MILHGFEKYGMGLKSIKTMKATELLVDLYVLQAHEYPY